VAIGARRRMGSLCSVPMSGGPIQLAVPLGQVGCAFVRPGDFLAGEGRSLQFSDGSISPSGATRRFPDGAR
jgi:hypothetical protein